MKSHRVPAQVVRPSGFRDQQLGSDPDPSKAAWASTDHLRSLYGHKRSKDSHLRYRADTMPSQEPDMDVLEEEEEEEIVPLTAASLHFEVRCDAHSDVSARCCTCMREVAICTCSGTRCASAMAFAFDRDPEFNNLEEKQEG